MKNNYYKKYYELKDKCRNMLIPFLEKALSEIPKINNPYMLDVGCGTGETTLTLSNNFGGFVNAIDLDNNALNCLKEKIQVHKSLGEIEITNTSLFDLTYKNETYDITLAEGILNVVGFKEGFNALVKLAKKQAFFIIHDEDKNLPEKLEHFSQHNCKLIKTIFLSEHIWWDYYYKHLEFQINQICDGALLKLFKQDLTEIQGFKTNPALFRSVYFIIKHTN